MENLSELLAGRPQGDVMIRAREIWEMAGKSESWFYETLVSDPAFPPPIRIGRSRLWWRSEILAFFEGRRDGRRDPTANPAHR